jgi:sulfatase modifying factor 1
MKQMLSLIIAFTSAASASAVSIDTVPVGNVGNGNDPFTANLFGGVSYPYRIGKYEVTIGQYTEFLNAVASVDTYQLYDVRMATNLHIAGISRSGAPGSYSYSVIGSAARPITYVSWGDAARFANWLHNGQPNGAQGSRTTEDGAYSLNGAITSDALAAVTRNVGARWFLPSESEWYKAAYHQPAEVGGDSDGYWLYPLRSNNPPYSDQPPGATPDTSRVGNFRVDDGIDNGYNDGFAITGQNTSSENQNYLTDVGAYTLATSYYGTFDQGGNVMEWTEGLVTPFESRRVLRDAGWSGDSMFSRSATQAGVLPVVETSVYGFRVATIPEPTTTAIVLAGLLVFLAKRRKQTCQEPLSNRFLTPLLLP